MAQLLEDFLKILETVQASPLLPVWILIAFLVAGALFFPVWLVIFKTGLLVAPPFSPILALAGACLSATTFYMLGRLFRERIERKLATRPKVLNAVRGAHLEHIVALRLFPVLPFTLVNMSCGALGVSYRTFMTGTILGMSPGILAVTLLGDRAVKVFIEPTLTSVAALLGAAVLFVVVATAFRRFMRKRLPVVDAPSQSSSGDA